MKSSLTANLKMDIPSSIVVFLVALPLCLGIAMGSEVPLKSGLIAGIIGGIVVGYLSDSHTSVSGPAAGLITVVLAAIASVGGDLGLFFLAVMLSGLVQIVLGLAKGGIIANYIPSNVIKGLLASIGIILILKQIPHAVGIDKDAFGDFSFIQKDGENTFSELMTIFSEKFSLGAFLICAASMVIILGWNKTPMKRVKVFPASLFVVIFGIGVNYLYGVAFPEMEIKENHLVVLPALTDPSSFFTTPNFSGLGNYNVWVAAITIALIGSLETLLNLEAIENIDPHKRQASPNRELMAQGTGNIISGLLGGLPITSVIVRSSANIDSGAATKISTIIHGFMLLTSILVLAPVLNLIPNASLAAILLLIGYKLAKVSIFKEMYRKGMNQFVPYVVTIVAILFTDLLTGVLIGLGVSIFFILKSNYTNPFTIKKQTTNVGDTMIIQFPNQVSFLNKASVKDTLWSIEEGAKVIIDAKSCNFIDVDVMSILEEFKGVVAREKNIQLNILGMKEHYTLENHIDFVHVLAKEEIDKLTPADVVGILRRGNERFVEGRRLELYTDAMEEKQVIQHPIAVVVSGVDPQVNSELIFDAATGTIVSIRIAANMMTSAVVESIEFVCQKYGIKLVVILGHSECEVVEAVLNNYVHGREISKKIEVVLAESELKKEHVVNDSTLKERVMEQNVVHSIKMLLAGSTSLSKGVAVVQALYDKKTKKVTMNTRYSVQNNKIIKEPIEAKEIS